MNRQRRTHRTAADLQPAAVARAWLATPHGRRRMSLVVLILVLLVASVLLTHWTQARSTYNDAALRRAAWQGHAESASAASTASSPPPPLSADGLPRLAATLAAAEAGGVVIGRASIRRAEGGRFALVEESR